MARDPKLLRKAYETKLGKDLTDKLSDAQIQSLSNYYNRASAQEQSNIDSELIKGMGDFLDTARQMAKDGFVTNPRLDIQEYKKVDDRVEIYNPGDKLIDDTQEKLDKKLDETSDSIMNEIDKLIAEYQKKIDDYKNQPKEEDEKIPEGLDDLLKDIKGEVGGDTPKKGGALAVIPKPDKKKQETLVGDDIDPEILSALGLEDVTDLDYGEYSSLLKEKMVANQMGSGLGLDQEKLKDEFKRVRGKTGKFTVKNQKIKAESFVSNKKKPTSSSRVVTPIPLLPGQVDEDIKPERQSFDKTIALLAGKLNSVDRNVQQTAENIRSKDIAEEEQSERDRLDREDLANQQRENRIERKIDLGNSLKNIRKTVKPVTDLLGGFFEFIKRLGFATFIMELMRFLKDPKKYIDGIIDFLNKQIEKLEKTIENFVIDKLVTPINNVINGFNEKVKEFTEFFNPFLEKLKVIGIDAQFDPEGMMIPKIDPESIRQGFNLPGIPTLGDDGPKITEEQKEIKLQEQEAATAEAMQGDPRMDPSAVQVEPQETLMGQPRSQSGGLTPQQKAFAETVAYAEGTAGEVGYNTWFGGSEYAGDLSRYTINEVVELQKKFLREGRGKFDGGRQQSAAVGKYQMTYPETYAAAAGLDPAVDKFTPENQDKLFLYGYVMKQAGVTEAEINSPTMSDNTIDKLAEVFASFPNMFGPDYKGRDIQGTSFYGQGGKSAQQIRERFQQERSNRIPRSTSQTPQVSPNQSPQPVNFSTTSSSTNRNTNISPPVATASFTTIDGGLGGDHNASIPTSSSNDGQTRVTAFSASDPTNLSVLATKSVYKVV